MKVKVSDFIADFLVEKGIKHVFTVVGGGAMHLNDSFGHASHLTCIYNHHEQACAMAAEAYYRVHNELALVCVTSGPGATNAITGVAGAWVDSIPMLVISGQTKTSLTIKHSGLDLRTLGNQEIDIIRMVNSITKYSIMVDEADDIRYVLEKALYLAMEGRPGPCWIDIPLDIQGKYIETEELRSFYPVKEECENNYEVLDEDIAFIFEKLKQAKRPIIYAGSAIRTSGCFEDFKKLVRLLRVPVVTCWHTIDMMETESEYYAGRAGTMGNRAGNFAVQNSDLVIALGNRLNIYQVGYDISTWAREAFCIAVDIDAEELKKPTIRVDKPICADVRSVIRKLLDYSREKNINDYDEWRKICNAWKRKYPVVTDSHYRAGQEAANIYAFMDVLSGMLPEKSITVVANGSASVVGSQTYRIKDGQRFIMNCALSSMGYDLPAAIGACIANGSEEVICIAGEGSMQMNLQELQTIKTNKLPIKLFVINNGGYHQIRLTQKNFFHDKQLVGVGDDSGDLGFPNCRGLAGVYGFKFYECLSNESMKEVISEVLKEKGSVLCEVVVTRTQIFEPKNSSKKLPDGTIVSPPLEDMAPFLSREELKQNMIIDCLEEM